MTLSDNFCVHTFLPGLGRDLARQHATCRIVASSTSVGKDLGKGRRAGLLCALTCVGIVVERSYPTLTFLSLSPHAVMRLLYGLLFCDTRVMCAL
jgi:hypothetical protein